MPTAKAECSKALNVHDSLNMVVALGNPQLRRRAMLVLTRKSRQSIMIGDDIEVSVVSIMGEKVRLGIQAPREIPVFRNEVYLEIQQQNAATRAAAAAEVNEALHRLSAQPTIRPVARN
jgi:carbon storage regulator